MLKQEDLLRWIYYFHSVFQSDQLTSIQNPTNTSKSYMSRPANVGYSYFPLAEII